jgi:hypothetical protein
MMADPVTVVTGFGRCGSTMVMTMLAAGGMDVVGGPPAYEDMRTAAKGYDADWVRSQRGKAVKVLYFRGLEYLPGDWRFLWLDRAPLEQAKSLRKFHEAEDNTRTRLTRRDVAMLAADLRSDRRTALRLLNGRGPVIRLRFEGILVHPAMAAAKLADFCGLPAEVVPAMAAVIERRSSRCAPDMAMELRLARCAS